MRVRVALRVRVRVMVSLLFQKHDPSILLDRSQRTGVLVKCVCPQKQQSRTPIGGTKNSRLKGL